MFKSRPRLRFPASLVSDAGDKGVAGEVCPPFVRFGVDGEVCPPFVRFGVAVDFLFFHTAVFYTYHNPWPDLFLVKLVLHICSQDHHQSHIDLHYRSLQGNILSL